MSVLLIIATLSIPALAISAATAPTHPTNATLVTCNPEQHGQMSKQWIELKKCYEDIIDYYLHTDNAVNSAAHLNSSCKEVDSLKTYINKFTDKAQCFNRSQIIERSLMMFYNLVNHTVKKTDDFRDFVKTNGSQCLNNARTDLRSCIAREDVRNLTSTHFNYNYWVSLKLGTDYGCNGQNLLKRCIDDALDKHRECKKNHVNFFHSLIDFVSTSFCRNETHTTTTLRGSSNMVYSTTNMLLSTLAVLTLL